MFKIGFVIPAHNVGLYIYECLRSCIYDNSDSDVCISLVNDGSTDNTLAEIERFRSDYPSISVSLLNIDKVGPGRARNVAIKSLDAKYFVFVDGDDLISRHALARITDIMTALNAEICCPNIVAFDNFGKFRFDFDHPDIRNRILQDKPVYLSSALDNPEMFGLETSMCMRVFQADFYKKNEISFSDVRFCEDVLPSRQALLSAKKIIFTHDDFYFYRLNRPGQRTSDIDNSTVDLVSVIKSTI